MPLVISITWPFGIESANAPTSGASSTYDRTKLCFERRRHPTGLVQVAQQGDRGDQQRVVGERAEKLRRHDRVEAGLHHPPRRDAVLRESRETRRGRGIRYNCWVLARGPRFIPRLPERENRARPPAGAVRRLRRSVLDIPTIATQWPVRCYAQLSLPALRAQPRAGEGARAGHAAARGREGECLRTRPHARAPGARGRRRPGARRARRRDRVARRALRRGASCCSKVSSRRTSCPRSRRGGSPLSSTARTQVRMLERARLERPLEVFIKINTGMNRLGDRARRTSWESSSASTTARPSPCCG